MSKPAGTRALDSLFSYDLNFAHLRPQLTSAARHSMLSNTLNGRAERAFIRPVPINLDRLALEPPRRRRAYFTKLPRL